MKSKYLAVAAILALLAAGTLIGRTAWRRHNHLVSLHVHNVPFADVLTKIQRQSGTKIIAQAGLDTKITLDLTDKPLSYVLNRVAEQVGARYSTLYAVYDSKAALAKLETALTEGTNVESVGWVKLAPVIQNLDISGDGGSRRMVIGGPPGSAGKPDIDLPPGAVMTATADVDVRGPNDGKADGHPGSVTHRQGGPMVIRMRKGGGGEDIQEIWAPEELILQSELKSRLGEEHSEEPTAAGAEATATKVKGKWTVYYVMRKSKIGGFTGIQNLLPGKGGSRVVMKGPGPMQGTNGNGPIPHGMPDQASLEDAMLRQRYAELGHLTPEQRVERARARQAQKKVATN